MRLSTVWCQEKYKRAPGIALRQFVEFASSVGVGVCCIYVSQDYRSLDQMTKITDMLEQHQISRLTCTNAVQREFLNLSPCTYSPMLFM